MIYKTSMQMISSTIRRITTISGIHNGCKNSTHSSVQGFSGIGSTLTSTTDKTTTTLTRLTPGHGTDLYVRQADASRASLVLARSGCSTTVTCSFYLVDMCGIGDY